MSTKSLDWLSRYGMGSSLSAEVQMVSTEMSEDSMSLKQIAKEHFIEMDKEQSVSIRGVIAGSGRMERQSANFTIQAAEAERHAIQTMMSMGPPYPWDFNDEVIIDSTEAWNQMIMDEVTEDKVDRVKEAEKQSKKFINQINRRPRRKKR